MEWISTAKALPEAKGRYLVVAFSIPRVFMANFSPQLRDIDPRYGECTVPGWWNEDDEAVWTYPDITYWMPLPPMPQN